MIPLIMPLSTLIENNNESLDVNFVGSNNFGNNAYRETLILGRTLVIPLIIMVIPTTIFMEITLGEATNSLIILWIIILNGTSKDLLVKKCMLYKKLMF